MTGGLAGWLDSPTDRPIDDNGRHDSYAYCVSMTYPAEMMKD